MRRPIFPNSRKQRAIIRAEIVKICDFSGKYLPYNYRYGDYDVFPAQVYDARRPSVDDRVGRNLINGAQWSWRISFENPNFGFLGMFGIYSGCGSIFGTIDNSLPGMVRKIAKFYDFPHFWGISYRF